jgi:ubiquinone/menaquinone biosynthesis C-methylase UbiE
VWSVASGQAVARDRSTLTPPVTACDIDEQSSRFDSDDQVDVRDLLSRYSVDELTDAADAYYRTNPEATDYFFAKPATNVDEAIEILACFAQVLAGVRPLAGMRVLDFGAGTGWSSRFLTQLGCEVVVCDVSPTALNIARRLFERQPVAGVKPEPTFLQFDGHHIDLPDESIDRIFCIDAFHHVPNPADVLHEFGRVLRGGGIAGFQEPGPNHSKFPQSQYEMKNYTVIENDIRMRDISKWAELAGFNSVELAIFTSEPFHASIEQYEDYLGHGSMVERHYVHQRSFVADRRIFFLSKGGALASDSRNRGGLRAELLVTPTDLVVASGDSASVEVVARNIGSSVWLPSDAPHAPVLLGAHLYDSDRQLIDRDHARYPLPHVEGGGGGVAPGEQVTMNIELAVPNEPGRYTIELDLVAELIGWFSSIDSVPVSVHITVH